MLDSVKNANVEKTAEKTAWHEELSQTKPGPAAKLNKTETNDLFFSPEFYPNSGFKAGPYDAPKQEFSPSMLSAHENQVNGAKKGDKLTISDKPLPPARAKNLEIPLPHPRPVDAPAALTIEQKAALHDLQFKFPQPAGEGMKAVQKAVAEFVSEGDKKTALNKYKDRFRDGINKSDDDFFKTEKAQAPAIGEAQVNYKISISQFADSNKVLLEQISALPKKLQAEAKEIKTSLEEVGDNDKLRKKLSSDFKEQPDFVKAVAQFSADGSHFSAADDALTAARKPLIEAAREQAFTRLMVMKAAQVGGDAKLFSGMAEEAKLMALRAVEIESKAKPTAASLRKI